MSIATFRSSKAGTGLMAGLVLAIMVVVFVLGSAGAAQAQSNTECLQCHDDSTLFKEVAGKKVSMNVDPVKFKAGVHADLDCIDCHKGVKADDPHQPRPAAVSCTGCHDDQVKAYDEGLHAKAKKNGDDRAASCKDCHGKTHDVLPHDNPQSMVWRGNLPKTCGECHGQKFAMAKSGISTRPFVSYQESVHGRAVARGKTKAAVCIDCHGSHDVRPQDDQKSPISRKQISSTCGKCHEKMAKAYDTSVHGKSVARGNSQAPSCADCHGIHLIKKHDDPTSPVATLGISRTCGKCHEGVRLAQEFGVQGGRASTYSSSYHGLASRLGSGVVANCASCHGVHDILPSSDPRSTINRARLAETCGNCHPGASENFIKGKVHLTSGEAALASPAAATADGGEAGTVDMGSLVSEWVRRIYLVLIFCTIGGMLFHNFLSWRRHAIEHLKRGNRVVERLTLNQRVQHALLVFSFGTLVITGFALKWPDSWIALFLGSSEAVRRFGHRAAAIVLVALAAYHLCYLLLTREGRRDLRDMWPRIKDAADVFGNFRYWTGLSSERPKLARFGYAEKAEYWALVWGTGIMGITGFMLWFPVASLFGFLPRWAIDAATAVHFYEAILATLAIPVWHFYQVMFSPEVYPMNFAFLDGRMSEEQFRAEHELAWEEMQTSGNGNGNDKHCAVVVEETAAPTPVPDDLATPAPAIDDPVAPTKN